MSKITNKELMQITTTITIINKMIIPSSSRDNRSNKCHLCIQLNLEVLTTKEKCNQIIKHKEMKNMLFLIAQFQAIQL